MRGQGLKGKEEERMREKGERKGARKRTKNSNFGTP